MQHKFVVTITILHFFALHVALCDSVSHALYLTVYYFVLYDFFLLTLILSSLFNVALHAYK